MKRIIQILGSFSYGDAIGNHTLAIHNELKKRGYESYIYAEKIHPRMAEYANPLIDFENHDNDILLYHFSYGTPLNRKVCDYKGKMIVNYHNITPGFFFHPYNKHMEAECVSAYDDLKYIKNRVSLVVGDSDYNLQELKKIGFKCRLISVPIVMDYSDYEKEPNYDLIQKLKANNVKNILFVGRIAPNKCHQDVIKDFYFYHNYFEKNSRLVLVGNPGGNDSYYDRLKKYIKKLGLIDSVIFPGHISFKDILSYYHSADIFLCESEHEGFCVPLIEAMYFKIPIIANNTSAVGETMGSSGYKFVERNPVRIAKIIHLLNTNEDIRQEMIASQNDRLRDFDKDITLSKYLEAINYEG